MAWFRVHLTEAEQRVVREERGCHPNPGVRQRILALWLLHHGTTREKTAEILEVGRASVQSTLIVVLLPAPLGPRRPKISPGAMPNETPLTAVWPS